MQTYSAITAEIAKLQARAEQLREAEKEGVIGRIREAIDVYGITAEELGLAGGRATARPAGRPQAASASNGAKPVSAGGIQTGVPKYQDPKSGKTWTGRGKPPTWIVGVKDRDALLINADAAPALAPTPSKPGRKPKVKAAAAPTVGVAKFRDPASGRTWTGRGKPPLWIAGAKDRAPFLIEKDAASASAG